jgi:hypothetical protein
MKPADIFRCPFQGIQQQWIDLSKCLGFFCRSHFQSCRSQLHAIDFRRVLQHRTVAALPHILHYPIH